MPQISGRLGEAPGLCQLARDTRGELMRTKLQGGVVVGFDGQSHVLIQDGVVVWEDDHIVFVGSVLLLNCDVVTVWLTMSGEGNVFESSIWIV